MFFDVIKKRPYNVVLMFYVALVYERKTLSFAIFYLSILLKAVTQKNLVYHVSLWLQRKGS